MFYHKLNMMNYYKYLHVTNYYMMNGFTQIVLVANSSYNDNQLMKLSCKMFDTTKKNHSNGRNKYKLKIHHPILGHGIVL